jgi:hypothetical protein
MSGSGKKGISLAQQHRRGRLDDNAQVVPEVLAFDVVHIQLDLLLEEIAADEKRNALYVDDNAAADDKAESLDPWERGADWWKTADED